MTSPLSVRQKLFYSCTSAGINIIHTTVSTWLLYFWAPPPGSDRPQYLEVTLVGILLTIGRLWDAAITPLIGYWSDVTRSRWGRRRPFLAVATPLTVITLLLLWTPPTPSPGVLNACYFLLLTIAFYTSLSLVGIPYDSSLPEMATTPQEQINLSMWKSIFGTTGVLIAALVGGPLFSTVGPVMMSIVVGAVALVSVYLTLLVLREKTQAVNQSMGFGKSLSSTWQNRQFLYLCLSTLIVQTAYAMLLMNLPYFVTLVLGQSEAKVSLFQGVVVLAMILSAPLWNWLSQRYPNRLLLKISMLGLALTTSLNFLHGIPGVNASIQALVFLSLISPFLSGYFILVYAMMAAVVDYDELLTQHRREALYYGAFSLSAWMGSSLATLIVPRIYTTYGYTSANALGIRVVFLVAGFLVLLGTLAFSSYRLGDTIEETQRNLGLKSNNTKFK